MKYSKTNTGYLLRLFKGERIIESLVKFCLEERITSGSITAIGGASSITLGYYDLATKEYSWKDFPEVYEIVSLNGNISLVDGVPFIHAHTVITDRSFNAFGGHLKEGIVAATCEVFVNPSDETFSRKMDDEIGLKLLDL